MTIEADDNTIWVRCGSGRDVIGISPDDNGNIAFDAYHEDSDPEPQASVVIQPLEAIALARMIERIAKNTMRRG